MNKNICALAVLASLAIPVAASAADDGPYKGRMNTVGAGCQGNTYFDVEAKLVGDKVEGTLEGSAFKRGPVKFTGTATDTSFTATYTFTNLNNLKVEITGKRVDADTLTIATKWAGGGPRNCETSGPAKKA